MAAIRECCGCLHLHLSDVYNRKCCARVFGAARRRTKCRQTSFVIGGVAGKCIVRVLWALFSQRTNKPFIARRRQRQPDETLIQSSIPPLSSVEYCVHPSHNRHTTGIQPTKRICIIFYAPTLSLSLCGGTRRDGKRARLLMLLLLLLLQCIHAKFHI